MDKVNNIKLKISLALLFTLMLGCPLAFAETKVSQILEKVVENHKQFVTGMTVSYQREILTKSMALLEDDVGFDHASGVFFFKGPNFLKVQQDSPDMEFVISNGKRIWWYIPGDRTAYRFDHLGNEISVLSMIFMGLKNPEDTFDVTMAGTGENNDHVLTLTPKDSLEEIDNINVTVSGKDFRITRIEITDIAGTLTRFSLGTFEPENDIDESFFEFKVPEGVKIIEEE